MLKVDNTIIPLWRVVIPNKIFHWPSIRLPRVVIWDSTGFIFSNFMV